jgi:hypothetical protein
VREHHRGHARPRRVTRLRAIPSSCAACVPAASRACPRFPPRGSMVRRGSTVRVRQRAFSKGPGKRPFSFGRQLSALRPGSRLGTGFGDRFIGRTGECGQGPASVGGGAALLRKPCTRRAQPLGNRVRDQVCVRKRPASIVRFVSFRVLSSWVGATQVPRTNRVSRPGDAPCGCPTP